MFNIVDITQHLSSGVNLTELANLLKCNYHQLYYFVRKHNISYEGRDANGKSKKTLISRKQSRKLDDKEVLENLYVNQHLSMNKIASLYNITAATVMASLKRHCIPVRLKNGEYAPKQPITEASVLYDLYFIQKKSLDEIAQQLGYPSGARIQWEMKYYGFNRRTYKQAGTTLYEKNPEKRELHRRQFYEGITGPKGNKDTSLERCFEQWAMQQGIKLTKQFQIFPFGHRYDFLINGTNIIIEMDGVFWHSLPEHVERDNRFMETAASYGYRVIRITDKQVKLKANEIFEMMIMPILDKGTYAD